VKLTTHLHLVARPKNVWNYTSTPPIRLHGVVLSSAQQHDMEQNKFPRISQWARPRREHAI